MKSFVASLLLCFTFVAHSAEKPHMLFFISDDQSKQDAGIYGSVDVKTPNLDALARNGMKFENAFVASPACGPSRTALLTGLMPSRNGAEANHRFQNNDVMFITKFFADAGYKVAVFGKVAHRPRLDEKKHGFDYYEYIEFRGDLSGAVKKYLKTVPKSQPVALFVGDKRPHVPWIKNPTYNPDEIKLPEHFVDTPETREHWARYLTDIEGMDKEFGEVQKEVATALGQNILTIYSSDHGGQWPFGKWNLYDAGINVPLIVSWPGKINKNKVTEAMVSWVDIIPTMLDIAGTSVPYDIDGQAFTDVLLEQETEHREYIYTTHSGDVLMNLYPIRSIRSKDFKFIWNPYPNTFHSNHSDIYQNDGAGAYWQSWLDKEASDPKAAAMVEKYYQRPEEEFYDLRSDPTEQSNLINSVKHKQEIQKMRRYLKAWIASQGDTLERLYEPYWTDEGRPSKELIIKRHGKLEVHQPVDESLIDKTRKAREF